MTNDDKPRKVFLTDGYKAPQSKLTATVETKGYSPPKASKEGGKPPSSGSVVKPKGDA